MPKSTRTPLSTSVQVPRPTISQYTNDLVAPVDDPAVMLAQTLDEARRKARDFLLHAPKFHTDWRYEDLSQGDEKEMKVIAQSLESVDVPSIPFSAQFFDVDYKPIFYYLGERPASSTPAEIVPLTPAQLSLHHLLYLSTEDRIFDGLSDKMCKRYHEATQTLASAVHPVIPKNDKRVPAPGSNEDIRVMPYHIYDPATEQFRLADERCGTYHLVHGWKQKTRPHQGLYLSSEHSRSGRGMATIRNYYEATSTLAKVLGCYFEALFPEYYVKFQKAFEAGVWAREDPGPWLGRAVVYKLQVTFHKDQRDFGPVASFPIGYFLGGDMIVPALKVKFTQVSPLSRDHNTLLIIAKLYHTVAQWTPMGMTEGDILTPGRIGNVFFTPEASYEILKDQDPGWASRTAHGYAPDPSYRNELVYIRHGDIPNPTPDQYWTGRIQSLAVDQKERPWVAIQWFYSPEHMKKVRLNQDHKLLTKRLGEAELALSDHVDVIDPRCIESPITILHFNDRGFEDLIPGATWYFRYRLRVQGKYRGRLEDIHETCTCEAQYSPEADVQRFCFACEHWYHVTCLDALEESPVPSAEPTSLAQRLCLIPCVRGRRSEVTSVSGYGKALSKLKDWVLGDKLPKNWKEEMEMDNRLLTHLSKLKWVYYTCPGCSKAI
ncbi:hypothetical protein H0H93_000793 [Arthromyces matolae]|nr:hypothetical protein H0H93_000793 [Arthromyces matolae]